MIRASRHSFDQRGASILEYLLLLSCGGVMILSGSSTLTAAMSGELNTFTQALSDPPQIPGPISVRGLEGPTSFGDRPNAMTAGGGSETSGPTQPSEEVRGNGCQKYCFTTPFD